MYHKFYKRLFEAPQQSFFLFGPRGTGKTTLIHKLFDGALWIDLLKPQELRNYSAHPERLFDVIKGNPEKSVIVIDEVQKVPSLLSVVHSIIEEKTGKIFVLTGSSSRKLKRAGADLLAGRALNRTLHPFIAAELKEDFSLDAALQNGLLPLLVGSLNPFDALQTYVGMYLKEEIQEEGLVRNLDNFARFLEVISFSHGAQLNIANVARECEVKRKTVENYIEILEDLLLAYRLPIFTKKAKRELSAHPKFYLFDAGVYRALRPQGVLAKNEEIDGAALEGLVFQHLMAWNEYSSKKHELAFWRTRSGSEVDFIIYGPQNFCAIEVKNSKKVFPHHCGSLRAFLEDYPMAKGILLYRGNERLQLKNVLCIPIDEFLSGLVPNTPI